MVGPTKVNSLLFKSLLISSDSLLVDGISFQFLYTCLLRSCSWQTARRCTRQTCQTRLLSLETFLRCWQTIPPFFGSWLCQDSLRFNQRRFLCTGKFCQDWTSQRPFCTQASCIVLLPTIIPACAPPSSPPPSPSSRKNSNSFLSSCSGTPHSASWYLWCIPCLTHWHPGFVHTLVKNFSIYVLPGDWLFPRLFRISAFFNLPNPFDRLV